MSDNNVEWVGLNELKAALKRNPGVVLGETKKFITRGLSVYKSGINNRPWVMGVSGGGAPVKTQNLRDTHQTTVERLQGSIYPTAPYAKYVHGGTRKVKPRPWLDFVQKDKEPQIEALERELLNNIVSDLAK